MIVVVAHDVCSTLSRSCGFISYSADGASSTDAAVSFASAAIMMDSSELLSLRHHDCYGPLIDC